jgi:uncharacterized membrane protein YhaH (DUF805 family)
MSNKYEDLEKLAKLKEQWILSDKEFNIEKKKILLNSDNVINYKTLPTYYNIPYDYAYYKWRINRLEYLILFIVYNIILLVIIYFVVIFDMNDLYFIIFSLIIFYNLYIITIKRLHDINISWWMSILVMIFFPLSNIILSFIPWTKWDNRFWPYQNN